MVVSTIALNLLLILAAAGDRSWGALLIAVMIGPIANGILAVITLCLAPLMKRSTGEDSVTGYVLSCVLLPLGAIVVDFGIISSLGLHGC